MKIDFPTVEEIRRLQAKYIKSANRDDERIVELLELLRRYQLYMELEE